MWFLVAFRYVTGLITAGTALVGLAGLKLINLNSSSSSSSSSAHGEPRPIARCPS